MSGLTRRGFLATAGGAIMGVAPAGPAIACTPRRPGPIDREWVLDVAWLETAIAGTRARLRTYNGGVPGPLLEARPGDTVRVLLRNHLTPYDSSAWSGDHNVPHLLNTTNLHLHGLEIVPHLFEPVGTADPGAAMIAIPPGGEKEYVFRIPEDQPPGFFWYHPHHHGSTAVQAVSGMAGGLIVRGELDEVPEIKAAREIVLALQDIGLFRSETEPDLWIYEPRQNAIWDTLKSTVRMDGRPTDLKGGFTIGDYQRRYYLVNGRPYFHEEHNAHTPTEPIGRPLGPPRYSFRPGEVVRFRILNGNSDNLMPLAVEGHEIHLLALDGVNFPAPRTIPAPDASSAGEGAAQLLLAPANRAEFLIKANARRGVYRLVQRAQRQQFLHSAFKTIAGFVVEGAPKDMALPTTLPIPRRHYPLIEEREITKRRSVTLSARFPGQLNPVIGMDLMVNGTLYDERSVADDWITDVGSVEEWHLRVPDEAHGGNEGHPFHIHVNSFEVHSVGGAPQPAGTLQDTIWVAQNSDVIIRMKFREWRGKSVFHCHILPHEDTGMMRNFLIRPPQG